MGRPYGVTRASANFLVNASVWSQSNHVIWPWVEPIRTSRKIRDGDQKKARRGSAHKGTQTEKKWGDFMCKKRNLLSTFMPTTPPSGKEKNQEVFFSDTCAQAAVCRCVRMYDSSACLSVQKQMADNRQVMATAPRCHVCASLPDWHQFRMSGRAKVTGRPRGCSSDATRRGRGKSWHRVCALAAQVSAPPVISCRRARQQWASSSSVNP